MRSVSAAALCVLFVAGCATSQQSDARPRTTTSVPTRSGRSLTTAQASALAKILLKNHQAGGAEVDASIGLGPDTTIKLRGAVDWTAGTGRVVLETTRSDGVALPDQTIAWGGSSVYLTVDGLPEALAAAGHPGVSYLERPVAVTSNPLDQVITLIGSFSSARSENPLLLRQGDTSYEGFGRVAGRRVEKLRFGRSTYSVGDDGYAYGIDTTFVSIPGPIVVRFDHHGPQAVAAMNPQEVLPYADFSTLYDSLVDGSPPLTS